MSDIMPLCVVGCGAISESYYFPALKRNPAQQACTWLVDPDQAAAKSSAARFGFDSRQVVADIEHLPSEILAAINATPSHLHVATTCAMLARGMSVLVEKPLAENATDARALVEAAEGRVLSVNQFRRLWPSYRLIHDAIRGGKIGRVTRIVWSEGRKFEWPVRSGHMFRRAWSGRPRGALLDMGVHVLDTVCWWLDTVPEVRHAEMDGCGGPEATVSAALAAGSTQIALSLSFLVKLDNRYLIEGSAGAIRGSTADYSRFEMRTGSGAWKTIPSRDPADRVVIAHRLLENFTAAIRGNAPLLIDAASAVRPLVVIDALYAQAMDSLPDCYREWTTRRPSQQPNER